MNVLTGLNFELVNYNVFGEHVNQYARGPYQLIAKFENTCPDD